MGQQLLSYWVIAQWPPPLATPLCQLIDLFPDSYNKKIHSNDNVLKLLSDMSTASHNDIFNNTKLNTTTAKKVVEERTKMTVNFDNELTLFRQMALIGDLFAITDELDSQLVRLGVFNSNDESAAPESKFLIQAYDGIHNEPCGTGATKHVIVDGKLAIFGPSTGQRYAFNVRNFAQNIGNDGVLVRVSYLVMPHGGAKSISNRIPILMPNVLHIGVTIENVLL
ncbi:unnamed protein product [Rotaria socialis]|uniref:Uncharacterized protein n=1 Tax=Rotaria socialis TaxID=392032 RepID=A0A821T981_9BILA|nr:unnamed protein product [Rotaria socialis]CAF3642973.1 unnamed protein product [Rotaria socialis]CAF4829395.1 unnamed protein product [Rotaria socialis]CAF4868731.1 unnamed protein product [Rotaria socialis]